MKPWKVVSWVIPPKQNSQFVAQMEQVLDVYKRPYNKVFPIVCMDESPRQLIKETKIPIPIRPGSDAKVDEHLYRSEQPHSLEMKKLQEFGIKTILNLRNTRNDNREAKATKLNLNHVPINTWRISYDDLVRSMIIIRKAEKPVLVHCLHGSDRTGAVVAVYRIVDGGWTKKEAIEELQQGGYGYHQKWFPNIIQLIASLDVEKFKADVEKGL